MKKGLLIFSVAFIGLFMYLTSKPDKQPEPPVVIEEYKGIWDADGNRYITDAMRDTMCFYNGKWYGNSNLPDIRPYPVTKHKHTLRWIKPPMGTNYPTNYQPTTYELQQWRESQKLQQQINN